jgi:asparagine synthase (glutamine-hydrolysing)
MCGIAGIMNFTGRTPLAERITSMTRALAHRGPDGEGFLTREGVALGHRRLSIIDVDGGQQPLANETGQIWLTFNGEIYNYRELTLQLKDQGHQFRTESDSEVIVHAYEQWGDDCVSHFRGMFAFAIVDFDRRRVLLACDQLGIKPLYYRAHGDSLAFASEISPLLHADASAPRINLQAIDYFLRYRYIPAPTTIYESIVRLAPGHTWSCTFDGHAGMPRRYWSVTQEPEPMDDETQWLNEFEAVFEDSVRNHLVSDVPFGAFLSGGVDSTLVVAQMAKLTNRRVQAFSIGFEEDEYSELPHARRVAKLLDVDLHMEVVKPNVVEIFQDLFSHFGQPFADTSAVPTWCVARLAKQHVSMVLSGDGADEAFAGYGRYQAWLHDTLIHDSKRILSHPKAVLRRFAKTLVGTWPNRLDRWQQRFIGVLNPHERRQLWHYPCHALVDNPCSTFRNADRSAHDLDQLEYAQALDLQTYLPGDILTKIDVSTMCHGLEARTPFTDVRVMEFAARVPRSLRYGDAGRGFHETKVLPKRVLRRSMPADLVHRRKQGFAIPEATWLRRGSPVRECFHDFVLARHAPLHEYFQAAAIDQLVQRFDQHGAQPTALWLLFVLGMWLDQHAVQAQPQPQPRILAAA